jgi:hypothetical protein
MNEMEQKKPDKNDGTGDWNGPDRTGLIDVWLRKTDWIFGRLGWDVGGFFGVVVARVVFGRVVVVVSVGVVFVVVVFVVVVFVVIVSVIVSVVVPVVEPWVVRGSRSPGRGGGR